MGTGGLTSMEPMEVLNSERCKPFTDIATWYLRKDTQKTSTLFTGWAREKNDP